MKTFTYTKKMVTTALCMALCVVLPYVFHMIPDGGSIFSPMHIPVLLCGLLCGWQYGLVCGLVGPFLSSAIMQMPPMGYLPPMLIELAVYGLVTGLCMRLVRTKRYIVKLYSSLCVGMLAGRVAAGIANALIFMPGAFTVQMWAMSYFVTALPGIVIQLIFVPAVVLALRKAKLIPQEDANRCHMEFANYLKEQYRMHPSMQAQDAMKLCYQAAFGAEHLLTDYAAAEKYFAEEYAAIEAAELPLYEKISPEVCRVNLAAWKARGLPAAWLFRMFAASVRVQRGSWEQFTEYLSMAKRTLPIDWGDVEDLRCTPGPVHHSDTYRAAEKPAYRIVDCRFIKLLPILEKIAALPKTDRANVIAIDGRAAAGKTTAAAMLADILDASVVHMDDFFLPPELRRDERLSTPGGNVHFERFSEEVLPYVNSTERFTYRIFDCAKMALDGEREVNASAYRIVEGAYSLHPAFGDYADLKVFLDIDSDTQMQRIVARNGAQMAEMFRKRWIPMEETYFTHCRIKENADLTCIME